MAYTHEDCSGHAGHALGHALGTNKDKNIEGIALWEACHAPGLMIVSNYKV